MTDSLFYRIAEATGRDAEDVSVRTRGVNCATC